MERQDCVEFLQWALPRLGMRWSGYRRVHRQVCKRLGRRLHELGLASLQAYRERLEAAPAEWARLDALCRITISRFYRDRSVFDALRERVLPILAAQAQARGATVLRVWSAGCACGEEPYSVALCWRLQPPPGAAALRLQVLASDADAALLRLARHARYPASSLHDLPASWHGQAFEPAAGDWRLRAPLRRGVHFCVHDLRGGLPRIRFDLILCRNLAFTYFAADLQRRLAPALGALLHPGGALVLGRHEALPEQTGLVPWHGAPSVFRRPARGASFGANGD